MRLKQVYSATETSYYIEILYVAKLATVKPALSGHSNIGKTKILKTSGSLMKVENIAECSPWSILQYF